jgi:hypothetical protein
MADDRFFDETFHALTGNDRSRGSGTSTIVLSEGRRGRFCQHPDRAGEDSDHPHLAIAWQKSCPNRAAS